MQSARYRRKMKKAAKQTSRQLIAMCSTQASALTEGAQAAMQAFAMIWSHPHHGHLFKAVCQEISWDVSMRMHT